MKFDDGIYSPKMTTLVKSFEKRGPFCEGFKGKSGSFHARIQRVLFRCQQKNRGFMMSSIE